MKSSCHLLIGVPMRGWVSFASIRMYTLTPWNKNFGSGEDVAIGCRHKHPLGTVEMGDPANRYSLDDLVPFPAGGFLVRKVFAWVWL